MTDKFESLRAKIAAALDDGMTATLVELLQRYLAADPTHAFYRYLLGRHLFILGRCTEAEKALLSVVKDDLEECCSSWEIALGVLYESTGRFDEAETWFRRSVDSRPDHTSGYVFLGSFMAKQERYHDAIAVLVAGLAARGDVDEVYVNLGNVKRAMRDYDGARAAYRAALQITPDYDEAMQKLSDIEGAMQVGRNGEVSDVSR